ncbi:hypothetical protein G6732_00135 [Polynucleobacter paneuropaeus]|nr:hypothetical protein [Polynucleobacter paneuropaeus]
MEIIAHRGYWVDLDEKNSVIAFTRALENGFGIETDFRDLNGELVVSHDIPTASAMKVAEFIEIYQAHPVSTPMALNIKSDGLHVLIDKFIADAKFKSVFVFDMAVPDMRGYLKNHIPTFTRLSEYEPYPAFLKDCKGVWLDAFESEWYGVEKINSLLNHKKKIAIVSPELHGRPHLALWELIRAHDFHRNDLMSICTDFPMQAKEYFYVQD